jgi:glycosyltransferase involved in cell wall biosynthesis
MRLRRVFLFSDIWTQTSGVSSLYRAVFCFLNSKNDIPYDFQFVWIYPSRTLCVERTRSVTLIGLRPTIYGRVPMYSELKTGFLSLGEVMRLSRQIGRPDIVHIATPGPFGMTGRLFAAKRGLACTGFLHTDWIGYAKAYLGVANSTDGYCHRFCSTLASKFERWFYSRCEILFCHTRASAAGLNWHGDGPRVVMSAQFLDTMRFPVSNGNKPSKTSKTLSVVYLGRLAREKSIHNLLEYATYPGIVINVVGDGPLRPELMRRYPRAVFHGYMDGEILLNTIKGNDYLVLPSRTETLGLVVLEAAACGVPSILIRGMVPSSIVERYESGILVDSLDEPEWIATAKAVRASPRYETLVGGCRNMATAHSAEFGTESLLSSWRELA